MSSLTSLIRRGLDGLKNTTGLIITAFEITKTLIKQHLGAKTILYSLAFEEGINDYKKVVGLNKHYIANEKKSTVALEAHSLYSEIMRPGVYQVETRIFDFDGKRAHILQEIFKLLMLMVQELMMIFHLKFLQQPMRQVQLKARQ